MPLHATILAHAPRENAPARLALQGVSTGLVAPAGMDRLTRWQLDEPEAFDADAWLSDLAGAIPAAGLPEWED